MRRAFNPVQLALHDQRPEPTDNRSRHKRMCWDCMKDKPMKGGTYPHHNPKVRAARWCCADCTQLKVSK